MNWIRRSKILTIVISLIIGLLSLEFLSYLLVRSSLLLVNETPKLYQSIVLGGAGVSTNWWTEQDLWGAWHKKSAVAQHTTVCFSANYRSNSIGARDDEFVAQYNKKTYILLGDSFAEGFGVDLDDSAHRIIEKRTGFELLNFGTGGDVGPLQYWLIYENLAKNYAHDGLVIFFLPGNDFNDNDYGYWVKTGKNLFNETQERYRPYYRRINLGEYDYFVPYNAVKRSYWAYENQVKQFLLDHFWATNVLRTIKLLLSSATINPGMHATSKQYSGYFDATEEQQNSAIYFLKRIVSEASSKEVLIVSIPAAEDFKRVSQGGRRENMSWWKALKDLQSMDNKIAFLDLIDYSTESSHSLFFSCDSHWSREGNEWAANVVSSFLFRQAFHR